MESYRVMEMTFLDKQSVINNECFWIAVATEGVRRADSRAGDCAAGGPATRYSDQGHHCAGHPDTPGAPHRAAGPHRCRFHASAACPCAAPGQTTATQRSVKVKYYIKSLAVRMF